MKNITHSNNTPENITNNVTLW